VISGDSEDITLAVGLLSTIHTVPPKQLLKLFYNFDEIADTLVPYMEKVLHKMVAFHRKRRNQFESIVNGFLQLENFTYNAKSMFADEKLDFSKQTFAISFLNRGILYGSAMRDNKVVVLLGDLRKNMPATYSGCNHITAESASFIFYKEAARDIIATLVKGEKTITQLSFLLNHSRPTIDKFVGLLYDELAIIPSRKRGNEVYYKINHTYFVSAQAVMIEAFKSISRGHK